MNATLATTAVDARSVHPTFADAVHALATPLRDVVLLRDVAGLNTPAIGVELGITRPQAQVALFQARQAIRHRLLEPRAAAAALVAVRP